MSAQYQIIHSPVQNTMGGTHLHTPQSIFQHMMGQQTAPQQAGPWLQMPQVPSLSMPWSISTLQQPDLIRFTGERNPPNYGMQLHQKRKLDTPDVADTQRSKQFITEEKMAAHFQGLHISPGHQNQTAVPSTSTACESQSSSNKGMYTADLKMDGTDSLDMEQCKNMEPRLVMSDELKQLQQEPMLPASLLSKLERPSLALVLWEPPSKYLRNLPTLQDTSTPVPNTSNDNNNNNSNNNNSEIPNLNQASSGDVTMMAIEPMDL